MAKSAFSQSAPVMVNNHKLEHSSVVALGVLKHQTLKCFSAFSACC